MAVSLNLVPASQDFTKMYLPVVFEEEIKDKKKGVLLDCSTEADFQEEFNKINPIFIKNKKIYIGPPNCHSSIIDKVNIVGYDSIDLYIELDDSETIFNNGITNNGFFITPGELGSISSPKLEYNICGADRRLYEGDIIFDISKELIKSYPIRTGSSVNFHCFEGEGNCALLFFIPKKRNYFPVMIDFVDNAGDNIDFEIENKMLINDPERSDYSEIIVCRFPNINTKKIIGFFELSTHIRSFEYDTKVRVKVN